jgi:ribosomal protein L11 methyltransferase
VIVANIIADVLRAIALQLKERVAEGGYLILSGILDKKESIVTDSFKDLHPVKRIARDEWVTLIYKKDADGSAEQQR